MEKGFLDKVEDNAAVRVWAKTPQREKGDSLIEGHMSELRDFTRISVIQNDLREMKEIWGHWDNETKQLFYCIYGLVVFPKALGHINETVSDLFDRLSKRVTPVPVVLAETFRSLNACRKTGEGSYSPVEELVAVPRRDDISEEKWMAILQNLQDEDIKWRAPWLIPDEILYRCGDFD
ncbi:hypothetical protein Gotur_023767 [Gossypium turneri]